MSIVKIVTLISLLLNVEETLSYISLRKNYFCDFSCGIRHTVCFRAPCRLNEVCKYGNMYILKDRDRETILHIHNRVRNRLALGNSTNGLPQAANMNVMSYSFEVEYVAQCWANHCSIGHDDCRSIEKFEILGQNIYYQENVEMPYLPRHIVKALQAWINEEQLLPSNILKDYNFQHRYSNFSQMIYAENVLIGCGRTVFSNGLLFICNYAPNGNKEHTQIYVEGTPCSQCKKGVNCNDKYIGLCGNRTDDSNWLPPFQDGADDQKRFYNIYFKTMYFFIYILNL